MSLEPLKVLTLRKTSTFEQVLLLVYIRCNRVKAKYDASIHFKCIQRRIRIDVHAFHIKMHTTTSSQIYVLMSSIKRLLFITYGWWNDWLMLNYNYTRDDVLASDFVLIYSSAFTYSRLFSIERKSIRCFKSYYKHAVL